MRLMNNKFMKRLYQKYAPLLSKKGSSLPMVVAIGTALVIFVMALMPLMSNTGKVASENEKMEMEYLTARSSIEFSKSELNEAVKNGIPYTFAVIENDGTYDIVIKDAINGGTGEYVYYVSSPSLSDHDDCPQATESGNKVTAICSVEQNATNRSKYDIIINTYNNGEENLSYSATYTLGGSMLIYPESYKQIHALPLNDFVLVDGQLGHNKVWDSNIKSEEVGSYTGYYNSGYDSDYAEHLLPWTDNPGAEYANAGEYPTVFKVTAEAAIGGDGNSPIEADEELVPEYWTMPSVSDFQVQNGIVSSVYDEELYSVYYNGSSTRPVYGIYTISVDFEGDETQKILPVQGLQLGTYEIGEKSTQSQDDFEAYIEKVEKTDDGTYQVVLQIEDKEYNLSHMWYGYSLNSDGSGTTWQRGNVIKNLNADTTYYFYCCSGEYFDGEQGISYTDKIVYAGMIYPYKAVSQLEVGKSYMVISEGGYALKNNVTNTMPVLGVQQIVPSVGKLNEGFLQDSQDSLLWKLEQKEEDGLIYWKLGNSYNYKSTVYPYQTVNDTAYLEQNRVLKMNLTNDDNSQNTFFIISKSSNNSVHYISRDFYGSNVYVKITSNGCESSFRSYNGCGVSFVHVPEDGTVINVNKPSVGQVTIDEKVTYGITDADIINLVKSESGLSGTINRVWLNDVAIVENNNVSVNAGKYYLTADIVDGTGSEYSGVRLGVLSIERKSYSLEEGKAISVNSDPKQYRYTASIDFEGWNSNGGTRYYGVTIIDEDDVQHDYWYQYKSEVSNIVSNLKPGTYSVFVMQGDTVNYFCNTNYTDYSVEATIKHPAIDVSDWKDTFFGYSVSEAGEITWYQLPADKFGERLRQERLTLVYREMDSDVWSEEYSNTATDYGIIIEDSAYDNLDNVYEITDPFPISAVEGHQPSMLKASSMYFMGEEASINTHGNMIALTTDLLVLNSKIETGETTDGNVYVYSYTPGNEYVLVFFTENYTNKSNVTFSAYDFYLVKSGTDLISISSEDIGIPGVVGKKAYKYENSKNEAAGGLVIGVTKFNEDIQAQIQAGQYPELNLDIAYATPKQIAHIISSEVIGWTNLGDLSGSDTENENNEYVICGYVESITGDVTYGANRVLIAAAKETAYTLSVPSNLTIVTRYLSVDANAIIQGDINGKFLLVNLAESNSWFTKLYNSKTLQMDYERETSIQLASGVSHPSIKAQICRYKTNTNLFANTPPSNLPLTSAYTTNTINNDIQGAVSDVKIIERYTVITKDTANQIAMSGAYGRELQFYTNFLKFDSGVTEVELYSLVSGSSTDIIVNSQESGYATTEYLGLFKYNSAEFRSGTLIQFVNDVTFKRDSLIFTRDRYTIPAGFYFVEAETDGSTDGTSLFKIAKEIHNANVPGKSQEELPYAVPLDNLADYAVYVDKNGNLTNAFVDTGIMTGQGTVGGFSGGAMQ